MLKCPLALSPGVMGAVVAPLTILGGPLLLRAAWYTAGIVGGLSTVAMCAPSEKFLNMGAPLGVGLGVVFVSSLGKPLCFDAWFLVLKSSSIPSYSNGENVVSVIQVYLKIYASLTGFTHLA